MLLFERKSEWLTKSMVLPFPSNSQLSSLGLFDMSAVLKGKVNKLMDKKRYENMKIEKIKSSFNSNAIESQILAYFEHFDNQNKTMIELLKKINNINLEMLNYLRAA